MAAHIDRTEPSFRGDFGENETGNGCCRRPFRCGFKIAAGAYAGESNDPAVHPVVPL